MSDRRKAIPTIYQIGVECFGIADALMEAELIEMTDQLWKQCQIRDAITLN